MPAIEKDIKEIIFKNRFADISDPNIEPPALAIVAKYRFYSV